MLGLAEFHFGLSVLEFAALKNAVMAILYLTAGTCGEIYEDY